METKMSVTQTNSYWPHPNLILQGASTPLRVKVENKNSNLQNRKEKHLQLYKRSVCVIYNDAQK